MVEESLMITERTNQWESTHQITRDVVTQFPLPLEEVIGVTVLVLERWSLLSCFATEFSSFIRLT
jgi:hypothetical protein